MPLSKDFHISIQCILYRGPLTERERKRVQRKRIWFKCIFLTNTTFSLRIKNGYLDVSGWWNLVQFRRWWEWAGDRILIWTFKNKVYTSHAGGGLRRGGGCDDIPREILLRTFKLSKNKCLEELPLFGFHTYEKTYLFCVLDTIHFWKSFTFTCTECYKWVFIWTLRRPATLTNKADKKANIIISDNTHLWH